MEKKEKKVRAVKEKPVKEKKARVTKEKAVKEKKEHGAGVAKEKVVKEKPLKDKKVRAAVKEKVKAVREKAVKTKDATGAGASEKEARVATAAKPKHAHKAEHKSAHQSEYHTLTTGSGHYETTFNKMYLDRKPWVPENPNQIRSFMPGSIEEIRVTVGDAVSEGDILLIFRAMKMNNLILSPATGRVKAVNVAAGENIPKNFVMIEIE